MECSVGGCAGKVTSVGLCARHYHKKWYAERRKPCSVDGCKRKLMRDGLCSMHLGRRNRYGSEHHKTAQMLRNERTEVVIDGKRQCVTCHEWKPNTLEFFDATRKQTRIKMKQSCSLCCKQYVYAAGIRKLYGLDWPTYQAMITAQCGKCKICLKELAHGSQETSKKPHVDNDHKTGKIRGILCFGCNILLGKAKDSIEILNNSITYLQETAA